MGVQAILRDIVVTQNFQIQGMRTVLGLKNFDATADCVVEISAMTEIVDPPAASPVKAPTPTGTTSDSSSLSTQIFMGLMVSLLLHLLY